MLEGSQINQYHNTFNLFLEHERSLLQSGIPLILYCCELLFGESLRVREGSGGSGGVLEGPKGSKRHQEGLEGLVGSGRVQEGLVGLGRVLEGPGEFGRVQKGPGGSGAQAGSWRVREGPEGS